jgi:hypothetical protein
MAAWTSWVGAVAIAASLVACRSGSGSNDIATVPVRTTEAVATTVVGGGGPSSTTGTTVVTLSPPTSVPEATDAASCANANLLAAVQALQPGNPEWDPTSVHVDACRNGYAEVVVTFDQSRCPTPGVECRDNQQVWLHDADGSWTLVDMGTGIGCSPEEMTSSIEAACAALEGGTTIAVSDAYCTQAQSLEGERPEAYVGSAEQIADFEALRAVAPAEVAAHLDVIIEYLRSGAVTASDPDSNLIENFPADVQEAIAQISSINQSSC